MHSTSSECIVTASESDLKALPQPNPPSPKEKRKLTISLIQNSLRGKSTEKSLHALQDLENLKLSSTTQEKSAHKNDNSTSTRDKAKNHNSSHGSRTTDAHKTRSNDRKSLSNAEIYAITKAVELMVSPPRQRRLELNTSSEQSVRKEQPEKAHKHRRRHSIEYEKLSTVDNSKKLINTEFVLHPILKNSNRVERDQRERVRTPNRHSVVTTSASISSIGSFSSSSSSSLKKAVSFKLTDEDMGIGGDVAVSSRLQDTVATGREKRNDSLRASSCRSSIKLK